MPTYNFDIFKSKMSEKSFLYSDLHLDLQQEILPGPGLENNSAGRDLQLDYDIGAIMNSLVNLFNTIPGQRFLIPEYGLNLLKYIGMPVSKEYGDMIGNDIISAVTKWEPRINITKIMVNALPEQHEYDIAIAIFIPAFKVYTGLLGKLSNKGFSPIQY